MLRFFKKEEEPDSSETTNKVEKQSHFQDTLLGDESEDDELPSSSKYMKVDINALPTDPGKRPVMESYHVNQRDEIRKAYLQKGPFQPRNHPFELRKIGYKLRRFNPSWFKDHKYWLEYSIEKEAAFCLCCYLFKSEINYKGGSQAFVKDGFKNWDKRITLDIHSAGIQHNLAIQKCQNLMKKQHHKSVEINVTSDYKGNENEVRNDNKGNDMVNDDDASIYEVLGTPACTQTANRKNGQSCCTRMEGLIEVLRKKQEEQLAMLIKVEGQISVLTGREVAADKVLADKRGRLNGELKRIPNLSLHARLRAASVIIGDPAKLDLFFSLCNEERKEWVSMLLSGLI